MIGRNADNQSVAACRMKKSGSLLNFSWNRVNHLQCQGICSSDDLGERRQRGAVQNGKAERAEVKLLQIGEVMREARLKCSCAPPVYEACRQCQGVAGCAAAKGLQEVEQIKGDCLGEVLAGEHAAGFLRRQLACKAHHYNV